MGQRGTIAAGHPLTVEAGARIIEAGGNAVDAAVAAALIAFHCEPLLASGTGGGIMLAGNPQEHYFVFDFVPKVPGLGRPRAPDLDFHPVTIDFGVSEDVFHIGRGASAVPTALLGLHHAQEKLGRLPLTEVIAPAVEVCRTGFELGRSGAHFIRILEPIWRTSTECSKLYTVDGRRATEGDRLCNPNFADTLELLAKDGTTPFLKGSVAQALLDAFGPDSGGLLTPKDLEQASPRVLAPLRTPLWGGELLSPPPPSIGGTLIAFSLGILHRQGLTPADFGSTRHFRALLETELLCLNVRKRILETSGFSLESIADLLSEAGLSHQEQRLGMISPSGEAIPPPGRGCTTHISVLDDEGGAASVTLSNGEGCGHVVPGTGMHSNNFLGEADINPRGFHVQPPGETLPTMMSPILFLRNGRPVVLLGSGGSNRLRSALVQVAFNHLGLGLDLPDAINASRLHVEESALYAEVFDRDRNALEDLAQDFPKRSFDPQPNVFFGGVHGVALQNDEALIGFGDPRRDGSTKTAGPKG